MFWKKVWWCMDSLFKCCYFIYFTNWHIVLLKHIFTLLLLYCVNNRPIISVNCLKCLHLKSALYWPCCLHIRKVCYTITQVPKVDETLPYKFNFKMLNIKMHVHIINSHWQAILILNQNIYHHSVIKRKKLWQRMSRFKGWEIMWGWIMWYLAQELRQV